MVGCPGKVDVIGDFVPTTRHGPMLGNIQKKHSKRPLGGIGKNIFISTE
jgi:hypothetical protein